MGSETLACFWWEKAGMSYNHPTHDLKMRNNWGMWVTQLTGYRLSRSICKLKIANPVQRNVEERTNRVTKRNQIDLSQIFWSCFWVHDPFYAPNATVVEPRASHLQSFQSRAVVIFRNYLPSNFFASSDTPSTSCLHRRSKSSGWTISHTLGTCGPACQLLLLEYNDPLARLLSGQVGKEQLFSETTT